MLDPVPMVAIASRRPPFSETCQLHEPMLIVSSRVDGFKPRLTPVARVRLLTMDRFWAAHPRRLLCGGDLGEASVKTRPMAVSHLISERTFPISQVGAAAIAQRCGGICPLLYGLKP